MPVLNVPDLHGAVPSAAHHAPLRMVDHQAGDLFPFVRVVELKAFGASFHVPGDDTGVIAARDYLKTAR